MKWRHSRKGIIEGDIVGDDGTFVRIRLKGDHEMTYISASNAGRVDEDGEVITVRKSFLMEVK